jgi:hypothetical protein
MLGWYLTIDLTSTFLILTCSSFIMIFTFHSALHNLCCSYSISVIIKYIFSQNFQFQEKSSYVQGHILFQSAWHLSYSVWS